MRLLLPRTNSGSGCWSARDEDESGTEGCEGAGGAGRGSELAMLSRRNLPSCSRKSLSLPVVLVLMVEETTDSGGSNRDGPLRVEG